MLRRRPTITAATLLATAALTGCGTSGYGTVNTHQLELIPTADRHADAALVCGARIEAHALHRALKVARPHGGTASSQIAVANAVTADKPGGVVIVPAAGNAMLAPILSMRRAGIKVASLAPSPQAKGAAARGARAVAALVAAMQHGNRGARPRVMVSLLGPCESAQ